MTRSVELTVFGSALALALFIDAGVARADQCAMISAAQANAAVLHLRLGRPFIRLCEPCGEHLDPSGAQGERVGSAMAVPDASGYHRVVLNGQAVDLAYVFVRERGGRYVNLARLSGCEAQGVSDQLSLAPVGPAPVVVQPGYAAPPPVVVAPTYPPPSVPAPPPVVVAPTYPPPSVPAPPPVVVAQPAGMTYRYAGQVLSAIGPAPVLPGTRCVVQVQQLTTSPRHNCRVQVNCGGQILYGRGNSGFGVCGFNSVRRGLIFQRTATTITMRDPEMTNRDGDPAITLNAPHGTALVQDAPSPVAVWSVNVGGLRQY